MSAPTTSTGGAVPARNQAGRSMGWVLLCALIAAVSIAISLAVQLGPEQASTEPPPCGGLYVECCVEWDDNWGPCIDEDCDDEAPRRNDRRSDGEGLFDAEESFADGRRAPNC